MHLLEIIFIMSIFSIFVAYLGYPMTLLIMSFFRKKNVAKVQIIPTVTIIITAYNEENHIRLKADNTLAINYPKEKFQILVSSDGSTDKTNDIVKQYSSELVELIVAKEHNGKEQAQKKAVELAKGEIIVFTDVATRLEPDSLLKLVSNFSDPTVGCVSSEDRMLNKNGNIGGESLYVRYEMWIRRLESQIGSLVGLSGSLFAVRKEICTDFSGEMQSDFRTALSCVKKGFRAICDSEAIGYYENITDEKKEFNRKARTVIRGITVFLNNLEFLNIFSYGLFSYQYFCHKLLRWLVPAFLIIAFATNFLLSFQSPAYYILLVCQAAFYMPAFWHWNSPAPPKHPLLKIPIYFVSTNAAIAVAWWRYLKGERVVMWKPSER